MAKMYEITKEQLVEIKAARKARQTINGKTGSVLVPSEAAQTVIAAFEIYKNPDTSLSDVRRYIQKNNLPTTAIEFGETINHSLDRAYISNFLRNPMYVRADKNVYQYFLNKGYNMIDDIDMYDGVHGLLWHNPKSPDRYIKVAYHEGLVSAETWLAVQDKKAHNPVIPKSRTRGIKSWLTGLLRCAHCGRGIRIDYTKSTVSEKEWRYLECTGFHSVKGCVKRRVEIMLDDIEEAVYKAMKEHIGEFEITKSQKKNISSEAEKIRAEILRIETESRKLIDRLADADNVLFEYIQNRISEFHAEKQEFEKRLMTMERRVKNIDTEPLIDPLNRWDELSREEQNSIARIMIDKVLVSDDTGIDIHFSF